MTMKHPCMSHWISLTCCYYLYNILFYFYISFLTTACSTIIHGFSQNCFLTCSNEFIVSDKVFHKFFRVRWWCIAWTNKLYCDVCQLQLIYSLNWLLRYEAGILCMGDTPQTLTTEFFRTVGYCTTTLLHINMFFHLSTQAQIWRLARSAQWNLSSNYLSNALCSVDGETKETVACRVLQDTEFGRILMKYVDTQSEFILDAYLKDFMCMSYKFSCDDMEEWQMEYQVWYSV